MYYEDSCGGWGGIIGVAVMSALSYFSHESGRKLGRIEATREFNDKKIQDDMQDLRDKLAELNRQNEIYRKKATS